MNLKNIKSVMVYIVPIVIFIILFSEIDFYDFIKCSREIKVMFLLTGIVISIFIDIFIPAVQWRRILHSLDCTLSLKEALFIRIGSRPAKSILPLKSGELIRAFYLKRHKGFPISLGISSLIFLFICNFIVLLIIMLCTYTFCIKGAFRNISIFSLLLFIVVLYPLSFTIFKIIKRLTLYFIKKYNLQSYLEALFRILSKFRFKDVMAIFSYSLIIWAGEFVLFKVIFKTVGLDIPFFAILLFVPLIVIIENIPITISGLGTREATLIFFFYKYGSSDKLLSSGVLISFVQFLLPLMLSLFFVKRFLKKVIG